MESAEYDAVDVAMAYALFLQDRLVTCGPGFTTLRIDAPDSELGPRGLVVSRDDRDDGSFEITARITRQALVGDAITVVAQRDGGVVGTLSYPIPPDADAHPAMERQLGLYLRAGAAALLHDLPAGQWPSDLPDDFEYVAVHEVRGGAHLERVGAYSHLIVKALRGPLDLSDDFADATFRYAPFHDIGQVIMGDEILRKPGRLDPAEWRLMQSHTTRGRAIVDAAIAAAPDEWPLPDVLRNIVECHHEALDGSGYPNGFAGDDVPLEARIVSVADVFDALTSARPYKPGWSANEALEEMDRMVGAGRLDPLCMTALVTHPDLVEAVAARGSVAGQPIGHVG